VTYTVTSVGLTDIMQLRVAVLRKGTPATDCNYPEDTYPDVVHFGIIHEGTAIATSSWFMKECPETPGVLAMQLKGMAVTNELQGAGLGSLLIDAGLALANERGATIAWARARDSAMGFYERLGFTSTGEGFIDGPTAMPHHIVVRSL
jgi:GNAT superfamily N-acetyltransferase